MIAEAAKKRGAARGAGVQLLETLLASGSVSAATVRSAALVAGVAWRTMQDAAIRLRLIRRKTGMNNGWLWELPIDVEGTAPSRALGQADAAPDEEDAPTCLAAFGFEAPCDGLLHTSFHLD